MAEKADIKELAVAAWRLEKWLDNLNADRKMAAKSALRSIKKFIMASGVEVKDPLGSKFDPGLAVEVVNNEDEGAEETDLIIVETLAPYVYQNGELIQHARVIIGTTVKEAKTNNGVVEDPAVAPAEQPDETAPEESAADIPAEATETAASAESTADDCTSAQPESDINIGADEIERMMAYAKIL